MKSLGAFRERGVILGFNSDRLASMNRINSHV